MKEYNPKINSEEMDLFCEALLCLRDKEECYRFLEDICTIKEAKELAQRLGGKNAQREENLSGYSQYYRCKHSNHKQG